ncbi:DUF397 domain-containing protein [Streptomyces sp. NPDC059861]|uniref:DUF397 domain-containing protein n=1 Tax=Streptomyces sp. NPDC059861 TaxID=3346974 RepID=UPI0036685953
MASNAMLTVAQWRKSSYSGDQGGDCVECAQLGETTVAVRDSKNPTGPVLTFDPATFTAFVSWSGATAAE